MIKFILNKCNRKMLDQTAEEYLQTNQIKISNILIR